MRPPPDIDPAGVLAAVPVPCWAFDAAGALLWANAEAAAECGDAAPGVPRDSLFRAEDAASAEAGRTRALSGEATMIEGWERRADGARALVHRRLQPLRGPDGGVRGIVEWASAPREALAGDAQGLTEIIETLPVGVGIETPDGVLSHCNSAFASYYGAPPRALIGLPFVRRMELIYPRIASVYGLPAQDDPMALFHAVPQSDPASLAPIEAEMRDGRHYLLERAATRDGGRIVTMTDVSALREREDAAEDARRLLEDAVAASVAGFAILDARGRLSLFNRAFAECLGMPRLRRGAPWRSIRAAAARLGGTPVRDGPAFDRLAAGEPGGEGEFALSDGRRLAAAVHAAHGGGVVVILRDVTDMRRAEATLFDAWELARDVLEACPAPITMSRADDGEILYENPAARALMRCDAIGDGPRRIASRWTDPADPAEFRRLLARDGRVDGFERRFLREDGDEVWLALSSTPATHRGVPVFVTRIEDLTERRAREAELARQREIAHQAEKIGALGEVMAGVSHELNNPLTVLVGEAAILRSMALDPVVARRAERLSDAADRCARIVRSFLALARQSPAPPVRVDLDDVARTAVAAALPDLRAADAEVALSLAMGDAAVAGDADQVRQLVVNLVSNAAQALADWPRPRRVTVSTAVDRAAGYARLTVADTGPGVAPQNAARIFQPLFTTRKGHGAGIGLALCQRIASAHRGRITLVSEPGSGAVFAVDLPLAPASRPAAPAPSGPAPTGDGLLVLLVDDDADVRATTADLLAAEGCRVVAAGSAAEALRLAAERRPDVVISDMRMPDVDGLALHAMLCAAHPGLCGRFGFITGDTLGADAGAAVGRLGAPCLEKPFLPADLRALIARLGVARPVGASPP